MEKGTFSDDKVEDLINAYFTPVIVNTMSGDVYYTDNGKISARQLAANFKLRGVPATVFLKPDGTILTMIPGYKPADDFAMILKYIGEDHYLNKSYEKFLKDNS